MVKRVKFALWLLPLLVLLSGCAATMTRKSMLNGVEDKLAKQDYPGAVQEVEALKGKAYTEKDRVVFYLDAGMLNHYKKDYDRSNEYLTDAEKAMEELYTKSVSRAAGSWLLNDNTLEYAGEDYEDVYTNVFKSLNYLGKGNPADARVEIRRIDEKLKLLATKYQKLTDEMNNGSDKQKDVTAGTTEFSDSALGRYLSLLIYRSENSWDNVRIDAEKIEADFTRQPGVYNFAQPDLSTATQPVEQGRLNLLVFTGLGPDKTAFTRWIHTEPNQIWIAAADEVKGSQQLEKLDVINWPGIRDGLHFKFQLPQMETRPSQVSRVIIRVDGMDMPPLQMLESIDNVAVNTFKVKEPIIYLKTITRTVIKGLLAIQAKDKLRKQTGGGLMGQLTDLATDALVDATENADLRMGRFWPKQALIGEYNLAPGPHTVAVEYYDRNGTLLAKDNVGQVHVYMGELNLVESFYLK